MKLIVKLILSLAVAFYPNPGHSKPCIVASSYAQMFSVSKRKNFITQGAILALEDHSEIKYDIFETDGTELDLIEKTNMAIKHGCKMIIGMNTSKECLIAGPIIKKAKIVGISPTCGHNRVSDFSGNLYTGVSNIKTYSDFMSSKISKLQSKNYRVFLISQRSDLYSQQFSSNIVEKLSNSPINLIFDRLGQNLSKLGPFNKQKSVFVFTTYPLVSIEIMDLLVKSKTIQAEDILIASPSWIFDINVVKNAKSKISAFKKALIADVWNPMDIDKSEFYKKFLNRFNSQPHNFAAYSYDLSSAAISCYKAMPDSETTNYVNFFENCMITKPYYGVTGRFSFSKSNPFAKREIKLFDLEKRIQ